MTGLKFAIVEHIGITEDLNESIDMSDNEVVKLEGFPLLKNLKNLLASGNRIAKLASDFGESLPNLDSLILTNNKLSTMTDLLPLSGLKNLEYLSLLGNPVAQSYKNYRLLVAAMLPKLLVLDFKRVSIAERQKAKELAAKVKAASGSFDSLAEPVESKSTSSTSTTTSTTSASTSATTSTSSASSTKPTVPKLTSAQKATIKSRIEAASSLEELETLSTILTTGVIPPGFDL